MIKNFAFRIIDREIAYILLAVVRKFGLSVSVKTSFTLYNKFYTFTDNVLPSTQVYAQLGLCTVHNKLAKYVDLVGHHRTKAKLSLCQTTP
jgi:hypothetical protein